jgi:amidase
MSTTPPSPNPNILTTSVADLQPQLTSGTISSVDLVTAYLAQIDRHNEKGMKLRALISVVPRHLALQRAKELDEERWVKGSRGVFHGIPVVVKVGEMDCVFEIERKDVDEGV